jgi:hypothetical protein
MATEKLFHLEKDCTTGVETLREYTAEEYAQAALDAVAAAEAQAAREAEEAARAAARASLEAKLAALGIDPEELATL